MAWPPLFRVSDPPGEAGGPAPMAGGPAGRSMAPDCGTATAYVAITSRIVSPSSDGMSSTAAPAFSSASRFDR